MDQMNPNMEAANEGIDLLQHLETVDLSTVDRSFPVIKDGSTVVFVFDKFEPKPNKAKTGHNLIITLKLESEAQSTDGKTLKAGFKVTDTLSLVQTDRYNPLEKLADIQLAALGKQQPGFKFSDYLGRKVTCRVTVDDDKEYGMRNRFRYIKLSGTPVSSL